MSSLFTSLVLTEKYGLRMTMEQLATELGMSRGGLYNQISAGTCPIPTYMDAGKRWADCRDVAAHFDKCRESAKAVA